MHRLLACHAEPQRRYHTQQHLAECLALFGESMAHAGHPAEVELALWFHDAVYDVHGHDNESRSAGLAHDAVLAAGVAPAVAERIHALVMATRHAALPEGNDAQLVVDIDLAILAAGRARFDEYERQIRAEYAHVPEASFRAKRREILAGFLAREKIYATPALRARFEIRARRNLQRAIAGAA